MCRRASRPGRPAEGTRNKTVGKAGQVVPVGQLVVATGVSWRPLSIGDVLHRPTLEKVILGVTKCAGRMMDPIRPPAPLFHKCDHTLLETGPIFRIMPRCRERH